MENHAGRRAGAMGTRPKLAARGVGVTKGGVRILDGVDLDVGPGTFVALIGPSGAGKPTLLAGPERADEGEPVGHQDPKEWQTCVDWAVENGILPRPVDEAMTNEFLPEGRRWIARRGSRRE